MSLSDMLPAIVDDYLNRYESAVEARNPAGLRQRGGLGIDPISRTVP